MTNIRIAPTGGLVHEAIRRSSGTYRGARSRRLSGVATLEVVWICPHRHASPDQAIACATRED